VKIISLEAENVKQLRVVNIKPDGSTIVIGGDNAAGKSSVLDSIEYALGGAGTIPAKPIRNGQKKAKVVLDLGDLIVTRTFTEKGTSLVVKNKDGAKYPSPQAMLDDLVGKLTFDPLEFSKMDAKKRTEVLKKLLALDFDDLDKQYQKLFDERTAVNWDGKNTKAVFERTKKYEDVPDAEVSITKLTERYTDGVESNRKLENIKDQLINDKKELVSMEQLIAELKGKIQKSESYLSENKVVDTDNLKLQLDAAEETNRKIRQNTKKRETEKSLNTLRKKSSTLSKKLTEITQKKSDAISNAKFPVKGLSIEDGIVTFNGIPFEQCSQAERIKISVAMGIAMNPKLRILLIRDGSALDQNNLEIMAKIADKHKAQVWIERVSKGKECQVVLKDGEILND